MKVVKATLIVLVTLLIVFIVIVLPCFYALQRASADGMKIILEEQRKQDADPQSPEGDKNMPPDVDPTTIP